MPSYRPPVQSGVFIATAAGQQLVRRATLLLAALLSGGNLILPRIPLLAAMFACALLVVRPGNFVRPELGRIWVLLLAILAVSLVGSEGFYPQATAVRYANFLAGLMLLLIYLDLPRHVLVDDLTPLLLFFAFQALATPVAALLVPDAFTTFEIEDAVFYTLGYIFTYHETIVTAIKRPDGFFFEPGVLQIYLNIYLFIALFLRKQIKHIGLALAAVLATQSTTGIIIAVLLCVAAAWNYLRAVGYKDRLIIVILAPVLLAPLMLVAQANIREKVVGSFSGSTDARQYDFQVGTRIAQAHPVFGIGFDHERYVAVSNQLGNFQTELSAEVMAERTSSNGIILLIAMIGFPMFLVIMWGLLRQRFMPHRWLFFLLLFLSFVGEALILTPFFLLFIFSGFVVARNRAAAAQSHALRPA